MLPVDLQPGSVRIVFYLHGQTSFLGRFDRLSTGSRRRTLLRSVRSPKLFLKYIILVTSTYSHPAHLMTTAQPDRRNCSVLRCRNNVPDELRPKPRAHLTSAR